MNEPKRHTIPLVYYFITPGFILLDYLAGISVRVAVLDTWPTYKNLYYGFCIVCGVVIFAIPRVWALVTLLESTINFTMTILLAFVPYVKMASEDALEADIPLLTLHQAINLFLVGLIALYGIGASSEAIGRALSGSQSYVRGESGVKHRRRH
jgi:hypothetical protein